MSDEPARGAHGGNEAAGDPRTKPTWPSHRWGLGAFVFVEAVLLSSAAFVSVLLTGRIRPGEPLPMYIVLIGTIAPTVIAASTAVLITYLRGNGPLLDLRLSWRWSDVRVGVKLGLIGLVITTIGALVWTEVVGEDEASSAVSALVDNREMSIGTAVLMFVYLWLVGPICEEVIYRGMLWGAMERLGWGRWAAFLLSTAVFAVSHLEPIRTTLLLLIAVPIGLARLLTGRLLGSIVAHQMNNFLPALAILLTSLGAMPA
ncbi:MAG: CPBP family intramembrane metalloprotease [Pseudonocardiaceae bacterium]|nr:CPBP family intramembrane metalloprotease [Pseudonocardiaceae bacterium]